MAGCGRSAVGMAKTDLLLGIDLGGTKIHAVVLTAKGKVKATARAKTEPKRGYKAVLASIVEVAKSAATEAGLKLRGLPAIGIGVPGPVDHKRGVVITAPNLGWQDRPIAADLAEHFGVPVSVGNDVNMGALGEVTFGAARGLRSALAAYVGTGLGGGVVVKGKVVNGAHGFGGEIGHVASPFNPKRRCGCGKLGCLEMTASKKGLMAAAAEAHAAKRRCLLPAGGELKTSHIADALAKGCPTTAVAIDELGEALAWGLAGLGTVLDPQAFILGGGVVEGLHERILPTVARRMPAHSFLYQRHAPDLRVAALGDDGVAMGAAAAACL